MQKMTAAEKAAEEIKALILSGEIAQGSALKQEELATRLGISRTPIRDAIRLVAQEGMVELKSTGRAVVSLVGADELMEYFEIRSRLEGWLFQLAIPVMQPEDFQRTEGILNQMRDCDDEEWSRLNLEFHKSLYLPANRPFIMQTFEQLYHCDRPTIAKSDPLVAQPEPGKITPGTCGIAGNGPFRRSRTDCGGNP